MTTEAERAAVIRLTERTAIGQIIAQAFQERANLLDIAQEIAADKNCDLCNSERRIRLYHAIHAAKDATP